MYFLEVPVVEGDGGGLALFPQTRDARALPFVVMRSWVLLVAFAACSNQTRPGVRADVNGDAGGGGGNGGNTADAGPSVVTNGQVISTQAGLYEVETDVAVSASGVLGAVFMAQGPGNVGYTFSKDEGATWSPPAAILAALTSTPTSSSSTARATSCRRRATTTA